MTQYFDWTFETAPSYPEPDWVATFESDGASAVDGDNVAVFSSGIYGFGQTYKFAWNACDAGAISPVINPVYRTAGTNGSPVVRKRDGNLQEFLGEIVIRGGDQTSSGDDSARMELGLNESNRTDLLVAYGDTLCIGGAWYWDPDNWVWENNPGQTIVSAQLPKGDDASPFITFSNNDLNALRLRLNQQGINIWDSGMTMDQLKGHLIRFMIRAYYHETDGTVELWFALDADELVKQDLLNTDADPDAKVWEGTTFLTSETDAGKLRCGHYADSPYDCPKTGFHRLWWTGLEMMKTTDPDMIWAVEPPTLEA